MVATMKEYLERALNETKKKPVYHHTGDDKLVSLRQKGTYSGRGTFGLKKKKVIKSISDVKKGELIIGVSKQFNSINLYKVVGIRDGDKLDVIYSDDKGKKLDGNTITVWDFDLKKGEYFKT